ncbi:fimbria/pilus outer membrane usher protein, partial [Pantoea agglomerans]|uniref:fimbria/pilus outer membrane usher protein n=1 Tax=Enterobacter agglomerans TaxID=549 RepID=UPI001A8D677E|nr:fimbria/pilus outer membrane usher protein [Pantoea agglomerans]
QAAPTFAQGELFYGWRYGLTFYGGAQLSERYRGVAAGIGQTRLRAALVPVEARFEPATGHTISAQGAMHAAAFIGQCLQD